MENQNNNQAVLQALGYPTLALPQTVEPITKKTVQIQRVQYDPERLKKLLEVLGKKTESKSKYESLANALAQTEEPRSYKGGFGEEIISPWAMGASALARGFGKVYGDVLASEREAALKDRENELKAAQLELEADKKAITETVADDYIKYNNPNAKAVQAAQEERKNAAIIDSMAAQLEDIGKRFDEDFKNIDEMQKDSTRWGRLHTNAGFGIGATDSEKLARDQFKAWKGSMKNVLVNANRQAGSGTMSDADAARYEQDIGKAKTPAEARIILRSFENRMNAGKITPVATINGFKVYQE